MSRNYSLFIGLFLMIAVLLAGCSVTAGPAPAEPPHDDESGGSPAQPEEVYDLSCIDFEDVSLGTRISVGSGPGNSYQPALADIAAHEFVWGNGSATTAGFSIIENNGRAGGSGHEAQVNNTTLYVETGAEIVYMRLAFGEFGGNLNLVLNNEFVNFENFAEIDGYTVGGVNISVFGGGGGNDMGVVEFRGEMRQLDGGFGQFGLGGQELWIDDICFAHASDDSKSEGNTLHKAGESTRFTIESRDAGNPYAFAIKALEGASLERLKVRVLLEGDVVAAEMSSEESILSGAVVGQADQWIVELTLLDDSAGPFHYGFSVEEFPPVSGSGQESAAQQLACGDLLQQMGISAYIFMLTNTPNPYVVSDPTLGTISFHMNPPRAAQMRAHMPGAIPSLQMGGGSELIVDLSQLNCDAFKVQTNQWDTEAGDPPLFHLLGKAGQPLCGGTGQPLCPSNPPQHQWSSFTTQTLEPIHTVVAKNEEVHFSTFVLLR